MSRSGPRPHTWRVQGEIPHKQNLAHQRHRAQARFRGEDYELSFEEFQYLWQDHWQERGRARNQYCLHRIDPEMPWQIGNVVCIQRIEYLKFPNARRSQA